MNWQINMNLKFNYIAPIITLLVLFIVNFYLFNNQSFEVHDTTISARIFEQHQAFKDGQFPPRWSQNLGFGYGMPIFQFYAPLSYYLAEIFLLLNFSILTSIKLIYILISILAFFGAFYLSKSLNNKWGGLLSAVTYSLCPYHAVNIYVRGALAESLAIAILPWILFLTLEYINHQSKKNYLYLTLFLSGLFLSHNISVITFLPFWAIFTLFFLTKKRKIKTIFTLSLSFFNSFLISAFFLIPAYVQKKFTQVETLTQNYSNYTHHFLGIKQFFSKNWGYGGSISGANDDISFYLGNEILLIVLITGLILIYRFYKSRHLSSVLLNFLFFSFLFIFSLFLTTYKSKFIWDHISLFSYIQFPWRFLGLSTLFLAILSSYFVQVNNKPKLTLIPIFFVVLFNFQFFHPQKLISSSPDYHPTIEYIKNKTSSTIPDYLPKGVNLDQMEFSKSTISYDKNIANIDLVKISSNHIIAQIQTKDNTRIKINRFVFPNWQIKLDGQKINCDVQDFVYKCQIPEGKHQLEFYWSEQGINQISNLMSIIGIVFLVFYLRFNKSKT